MVFRACPSGSKPEWRMTCGFFFWDHARLAVRALAALHLGQRHRAYQGPVVLPKVSWIQRSERRLAVVAIARENECLLAHAAALHQTALCIGELCATKHRLEHRFRQRHDRSVPSRGGAQRARDDAHATTLRLSTVVQEPFGLSSSRSSDSCALPIATAACPRVETRLRAQLGTLHVVQKAEHPVGRHPCTPLFPSVQKTKSAGSPVRSSSRSTTLKVAGLMLLAGNGTHASTRAD